jgi:hypothetical protein
MGCNPAASGDRLALVDVCALSLREASASSPPSAAATLAADLNVGRSMTSPDSRLAVFCFLVHQYQASLNFLATTKLSVVASKFDRIDKKKVPRLSCAMRSATTRDKTAALAD